MQAPEPRPMVIEPVAVPPGDGQAARGDHEGDRTGHIDAHLAHLDHLDRR